MMWDQFLKKNWSKCYSVNNISVDDLNHLMNKKINLYRNDYYHFYDYAQPYHLVLEYSGEVVNIPFLRKNRNKEKGWCV